ncbi:hypothetical protein GOP47_0023232 [Adiantum capillus-veneris]|uniref:Uncharacterized protein n=1 Tax=Adiantum capillus-veneris TaxID=13818 RepID=A0A9D4Z515_ADICA|nr:hypothetical protein GOP47_0023232 [Adiantum capillus-veneris]
MDAYLVISSSTVPGKMSTYRRMWKQGSSYKPQLAKGSWSDRWHYRAALSVFSGVELYRNCSLQVGQSICSIRLSYAAPVGACWQPGHMESHRTATMQLQE